MDENFIKKTKKWTKKHLLVESNCFLSRKMTIYLGIFHFSHKFSSFFSLPHVSVSCQFIPVDGAANSIPLMKLTTLFSLLTFCMSFSLTHSLSLSHRILDPIAFIILRSWRACCMSVYLCSLNRSDVILSISRVCETSDKKVSCFSNNHPTEIFFFLLNYNFCFEWKKVLENYFVKKKTIFFVTENVINNMKNFSSNFAQNSHQFE